MKNKGFTLIELLAVIVVLAIIALIAVPMVLNTIEKSREGAAKASGYAFIYKLEEEIMLGEVNGTSYDLDEEVTKESTLYTNAYNNIKGSKPTDVNLNLNSKGEVVSGTLCINEYTITYGNSNIQSVTKGCNELSSSYVYATTKITKASDGSSSREGKHMYLRYELTDGEIASGTEPDYCIYSDVINDELCLKDGEYETSLQKIKTFFGYDSTTWTSTVMEEGTEKEFINWENSVNGFSCNEYTERFTCIDKNLMSMSVEGDYAANPTVYSNGKIRLATYEKDSNGGTAKNVINSR